MLFRPGALVAATMLFGLPASAEEIVRISGWGGSEVAIVNGLLTNVLAEKLAEEGIRVKYEPVDGDYSQFIINGLSAGTAPDLFYVDTFWARSVFSAGQAAPVTNDVSGFAANLLTAFTYDGKLYSIPKDFNTLAIHFNKDIFDDAGVGYPSDDDTWTTLQEKLVAVNKSLPEVDGLCVVPEYARFGAFALSTGWSPFDARGKTVLDKRFRRAFDFYTGLVKSGAAVMAADAGHSWTGGCLASERAAVAIEGAWILSALRDSAPNMNLGTVRMPKDPESSKRGNIVFSVGWTVNAASKVSKAAAKVAELLTTEEAQQWVLEQGLALPSRTSLNDNPWLRGGQPEQIASRVVLEGLSDDHVMPYFFGDVGGSWMQPINAALNSVILGEEDANTALPSAQSAFDRMLAK
ncbi:extracellular solute-binding protein [Sinorhizobium meliloti]|uniref:ABC transporter, periplasmic solute-binding protein n=1 Tax=Rhizobium meliloti (strain 1021) TaxID=266834 RepID=Q92YW6_RHIME|nr:extracellular solute-binding protein [Sinorhizobium meliloti]TWA96403.1 carbohydrate ABC transporter substrate-binding protein (CUT1 family) [Ensifer sp. SEMIA 134]TWB34028.1 carbohydrate ABC transporter substrate-binding protein (CUT1 family) [Ensifer sp. SEMIA 135]AAK65405.1 ABC transporter, periplasmic solute-binding protein [Sinorhizobium meliloti 1021]AGG70433.1 ABC transporter,periplasmic solute-binding protein [Sinorhizobium meliloti 2011]ASP61416.1 ABC transporter substrate-binding 